MSPPMASVGQPFDLDRAEVVGAMRQEHRHPVENLDHRRILHVIE
jgi:hypothetical protein